MQYAALKHEEYEKFSQIIGTHNSLKQSSYLNRYWSHIWLPQSVIRVESRLCDIFGEDTFTTSVIFSVLYTNW